MTAPSAAALLQAGADRHRTGDLAGAAALYAQALRLDPALADAHNLLGVAARQQGDAVAALAHVDRALALAPDTPAYLANRGAALAEAGRLAEAVPVLRAAAGARPDDPVTQRNLGQALAATGDFAGAVAPLRRATELTPEAPEPWLALAHALRDGGALAAAKDAAASALARAEAMGRAPLIEQAGFLLAGLGGAPPPLRAPPGYVRALFDLFAPRFDAELATLGYRTPTLLATMLEASGVAPDGTRAVLDAGCGTGLSGLALRPFAARMEGVDLSPRMLDVARVRGIYAELHEAELVAWLSGRAASFGVAIAADVLNYLGDLAPVMAGLHGVLRGGGVVACSVEVGTASAVALAPTLRYRHDPEYVRAVAEAAGFAVVAQDVATLREDHGQPVAGGLFVFRRG